MIQFYFWKTSKYKDEEPMTSFQNQKTALITGGNGGIGQAIARRLSQQGIEVAITDIKESDQKSFSFFRCNLCNGAQVDQLYQWVIENHGVPDYLILCAGQGIKEKLYEGDPDKWQKIIDINLMGVLRCLRAFVPQMLERQNGVVLFISSVAADQPHPYGGVYSASKAAVEMIAETLRIETFPFLRTTILRLGAADTDFFKNQKAGDPDYSQKNPTMRPEEIANDVYYIITRPGDSVIHQMITRPLAQKF